MRPGVTASPASLTFTESDWNVPADGDGAGGPAGPVPERRDGDVHPHRVGPGLGLPRSGRDRRGRGVGHQPCGPGRDACSGGWCALSARWPARWWTRCTAGSTADGGSQVTVGGERLGAAAPAVLARAGGAAGDTPAGVGGQPSDRDRARGPPRQLVPPRVGRRRRGRRRGRGPDGRGVGPGHGGGLRCRCRRPRARRRRDDRRDRGGRLGREVGRGRGGGVQRGRGRLPSRGTGRIRARRRHRREQPHERPPLCAGGARRRALGMGPRRASEPGSSPSPRGGGASPHRYRTDIDMRLGALGGRKTLATAPENGGFELVLGGGPVVGTRATSDAAGELEGGTADASRSPAPRRRLAHPRGG